MTVAPLGGGWLRCRSDPGERAGSLHSTRSTTSCRTSSAPARRVWSRGAGARSKDAEIERPDRTHPDRMVPVVAQHIARLGMNKDHQTLAVEGEKGDDRLEEVGPERDLEAAVWVRSDRTVVPTPELGSREGGLHLLAQRLGRWLG